MVITTREDRTAVNERTGERMTELKGFVISADCFDDEKIRLIESLPSGDQTLIIFFRMLSMACKSNAGGYILMDRKVPYTDEMLAGLFNKSLQVVRFALQTLQQFGMVTTTEEGYKIEDFLQWLIPDDVQREKTRKRVAKHREEQKQLPEPAKEKRYADDSVEVQLSQYLFSLMRENNPEAKEPNFQSWANHIRLMIERDKRKPEQIRNMIKWCQADSFWKTNILSTKKLREKYDQLKVRAIEEFNRQGRIGQSRRAQEADDVFSRLMGGAIGDGTGSIIDN